MRNAIKEMVNGLINNGTVLDTARKEVGDWTLVTIRFNAEKVPYCPTNVRTNKNNDPARALVLAIRKIGKIEQSFFGVWQVRDDDEKEVYRFETDYRR